MSWRWSLAVTYYGPLAVPFYGPKAVPFYGLTYLLGYRIWRTWMQPFLAGLRNLRAFLIFMDRPDWVNIIKITGSFKEFNTSFVWKLKLSKIIFLKIQFVLLNHDSPNIFEQYMSPTTKICFSHQVPLNLYNK